MLNDRYRIIDQVGAGGFGAVYKAADTRFGDRLVAVKEMTQKGLDARELAEAVEAFKREALLLAQLRHPHLPRIYDHFSDGGHWYLVMDYIEGETVEAYLQRAPLDARTGTRHLGAEEVIALGIQLCTVLDYLHTRQPPIIFRDLKPANVLRSPEGHLYLIDFGIARHFKPGQTRDTTPLGSPGYAAPEQYGKAQTGPRADIYSLGVILHQLLTGNDPANAPFRLAPLQFYGDPALSRLETLIKSMIDLNEEYRPASAAIVKNELQAISAQRAGQRAWSAPPAYRPTPGESAGAAGQRMAGQLQEERPRTRQIDPTRRKIVLWIGGLLVAGGIGWTVGKRIAESRPANQPATANRTMAASQATAVPTITTKVIAPFTYRGHSDTISSVAWSPDGTRILSASADKTVQVWEAATGSMTFTYKGHTTAVYGALWSPDGTQIISADAGLTQEWQASTGSHIFTYNVGPTQPGSDMAWSPDGKYLAVAAFAQVGQGAVQVWDVSTHQMVQTYNTPYPYAIAWSPDSTRIAIGTATTEIRVWNVSTGDTTPVLTGHTGMVRGVAWSPDGTRIASASEDGTVRVWDVASGQTSLTLAKQHEYLQMKAVAWSPDGRRIASGSNNGTVQMWDAASGKLFQVFKGHSGIISSLAWSPDGRFVVSGSGDHTARIWQVI